MREYLYKRAIHSVICIIGISMIVFSITRVVGDPGLLLMPPEASSSEREHFRQALGLDKPLYIQYLDFVKNVGKGNFGESYRFRVPVFELILGRFPATIELATAAILFAIVFGFSSGIVSAVRPRSGIAKLVKGFALAGMAAPTFWTGIMLILVFGVQLRLFPISGRGGIKSIVLPMITLGWYSTAVISRMVRSTMLDVLDSDYIRMAVLKGAPQRVIMFKLCLRNVLTTMVTIVSLQFVILLAGSVITETIFAWPGIGRLMIQAVYGGDYPVVQGITLICSVIFVVTNLIVDLLYVLIDPRIKYT